MTTYAYGGFTISDGVAYFLTAKDLSLPTYKQTLFQIGRLEGSKKTGERVNEKQISVTIKVLGVSRADLEAKLDALFAALTLRQQPLTLHAEDARYYIADAVSASAQFSAGRIIACDVRVGFVAQQPFAYAPSPSVYSSGSLAFVTAGAGIWQPPVANRPLVVTGSGNFFARPTITLTNNTAPNATTLTSGLTSGSPYTSLSVAALPAAATSGQVFLLSFGANVQRVTLSANALLGATSISVTSFNANYSYPSGAFCGLDCYLTGFTLSQNPDGQVLAVSGLGAQAVGSGQSLAIDCDPLTANGYTVIPSSSGSPVVFTGAFPVLEPGQTQFTLQVNCANAPLVTVGVVWTARWLS